MHLLHDKTKIFVLFLTLVLLETVVLVEFFIFQFCTVPCEVLFIVELLDLVLALLTRFVLFYEEGLAVPDLAVGLLESVHGIASVHVFNDCKILLDREALNFAESTKIVLEICILELPRKVFDKKGALGEGKFVLVEFELSLPLHLQLAFVVLHLEDFFLLGFETIQGFNCFIGTLYANVYILSVLVTETHVSINSVLVLIPLYRYDVAKLLKLLSDHVF